MSNAAKEGDCTEVNEHLSDDSFHSIFQPYQIAQPLDTLFTSCTNRVIDHKDDNLSGIYFSLMERGRSIDDTCLEGVCVRIAASVGGGEYRSMKELSNE
jgi:hypothetical protein